MPAQPSLAADELILSDPDNTVAALVIHGQVRPPTFVVSREMTGVTATELVGVFRDYFEHRRQFGDLGHFAAGRYDLFTDEEFADHVQRTQDVVTAAHVAADTQHDSLDSNWLMAAFHGQLLNYALARRQLEQVFRKSGDATNALNDGIDHHGWHNLPAAVIHALSEANQSTLPAAEMGKTWHRDRDRGEAICAALAPWWTRYAARLNEAPETISMPVEAPASWRVAANDSAKFIKQLDAALRAKNPGTTLPDYIGFQQQWHWLAHVGTRVFPTAFIQASANALPQTAYTVAHVARSSSGANAAPLPTTRIGGADVVMVGGEEWAVVPPKNSTGNAAALPEQGTRPLNQQPPRTSR